MENMDVNPETEGVPKKPSKMKAIFAAMVAVVLVVGGVYFFVFGQSEEGPPTLGAADQSLYQGLIQTGQYDFLSFDEEDAAGWINPDSEGNALRLEYENSKEGLHYIASSTETTLQQILESMNPSETQGELMIAIYDDGFSMSPNDFYVAGEGIPLTIVPVEDMHTVTIEPNRFIILASDKDIELWGDFYTMETLSENFDFCNQEIEGWFPGAFSGNVADEFKVDIDGVSIDCTPDQLWALNENTFEFEEQDLVSLAALDTFIWVHYEVAPSDSIAARLAEIESEEAEEFPVEEAEELPVEEAEEVPVEEAEEVPVEDFFTEKSPVEDPAEGGAEEFPFERPPIEDPAEGGTEDLSAEEPPVEAVPVGELFVGESFLGEFFVEESIELEDLETIFEFLPLEVQMVAPAQLSAIEIVDDFPGNPWKDFLGAFYGKFSPSLQSRGILAFRVDVTGNTGWFEITELIVDYAGCTGNGEWLLQEATYDEQTGDYLGNQIAIDNDKNEYFLYIEFITDAWLQSTPRIYAGESKYFIVYHEDLDCSVGSETTVGLTGITVEDNLGTSTNAFSITGQEIDTTINWELH